MSCALGALTLLAPVWLHAAALTPRAIEAFQRYERLTEARMDTSRARGAFLWVDSLPAEARSRALAQLHRGDIITSPLKTEDDGRAVAVPDALLLHSIGAIFVPGASFERTSALVRDYDTHAALFGPGVRRSRLVRRQGDDYIVERQLFRKKIITLVLNTTFVDHYTSRSPTQLECRSRTTRVAEVADAGRPTEHEKPVDPDPLRQPHLYTYYRVEARDGGVYLEYETLYLGSKLPAVIQFFASPLVNSVPGEVERDLLRQTRAALSPAPAR